MRSEFSTQQLQAYLDESLPPELMSAIEQQLRVDESLRQQLLEIAGQREAGVHGIGEIWRRNRLSCPSRQQLGSLLLGVLEDQIRDYVQFHVNQVGCRLCQANLEDLKRQQSEQHTITQNRRRRYFQTSAGYLGRSENP